MNKLFTYSFKDFTQRFKQEVKTYVQSEGEKSNTITYISLITNVLFNRSDFFL